jgi:hypothetical protein
MYMHICELIAQPHFNTIKIVLLLKTTEFIYYTTINKV